ncbi:C2 family cysteine protease [Bradyrhizobium japonicum]|uniref:C2 family cysteine protease n=1 Tax=Bradyrhizobium japonicum TaxID=375 RepID=UPI0012FD8A40|nr:C2 family cysteine protease [Bradyrhizobium japonicum]
MSSDSFRLQICSAGADGQIGGRAKPQAVIEAINLSRLVWSRLTWTDTEVLSVVGHDGVFAGQIAARAGDLIRLRVRWHGSRLGPSRTLRLPCDGRAPYPAVALFRIGFSAIGTYRYQLVNIGQPRPISEPGALLYFKNERTGLVQRSAIGEHGGFAKPLYIAAWPDDRIVVTLSKRSEEALGTLVVPSPIGDHRTRKRLSQAVSGHSGTLFDIGSITGRLFQGKPKASDVIQGEVPNCHLAGAATAVAATCGDRLARLFHPVDTRSYSVSLYCHNQTFGRFVRKTIVVSKEFYVRPSGELLFGAATLLSADPARAALWWPLLEKAVALLNKGYGHFVTGGTAHHALSLLLGLPPCHRKIRAAEADRLWRETVAHIGARRPVVLSTFPATSARLYRYTQVIPDHCYAIVGLWERKRDQRMIRLRNPWGEVTPVRYADEGHGVFTMPWDEAVSLFSIWSSVSDPR